MRTIIAGSRTGGSIQQITAAVAASGFLPSVVISGTARGVDQFGEYWAASNGIPVERYPADWAKHGKSAGHRRNAQMAMVAEALIALWDGKSPGTRNMIETAEARGLQVYIHRI